MALYFKNKSACMICGKLLDDKSKLTVFPAFIANEKSRYFKYSDTVVHTTCLIRDPEHKHVLRLKDKFLQHILPENRKCYIDGSTIKDSDDHVFIDYVTDDKKNYLSELLYSNFSLSNLKKWDKLERLRRALLAVKQQGGAQKYITWLLDRIN